MKRRIRVGFSLIELLVVVAIITVLAGGVTLAYQHAQVADRDSRRISDTLLIGRSIDQSASLNRNLYPKRPGGGASATLCADELIATDGSNPNSLDLSLFAGRSVPSDPNPVTPRSGSCTTFLNGYLYSTEYGHTTAAAGCTAGVLAVCQKLYYTLEVGLERVPDSGVDALRSPAQIGADATQFPAAQSGRSRYILTGRSCGNNCYN